MFHHCVRKTISRKLFPTRRSYSTSHGPSSYDYWVGTHAILGGTLMTEEHIKRANKDNDMHLGQILIETPLAIAFGVGIGAFIGYTSILSYPLDAGGLLWNYTKNKKSR